MFAKDLAVGNLLDFYRPLLPERQADVLELYYNDDLSLSEIAEDIGISRQGVRHLIKRGEDALRGYEEGLGLAKRFRDSEETAALISLRIAELCTKISDPDVLRDLGEIDRLARSLADSGGDE